MKLNPKKSYSEGVCSICGKMIKPRYKGWHKKGVCHQCRCKTLKMIEKFGIVGAAQKGWFL